MSGMETKAGLRENISFFPGRTPGRVGEEADRPCPAEAEVGREGLGSGGGVLE